MRSGSSVAPLLTDNSSTIVAFRRQFNFTGKKTRAIRMNGGERSSEINRDYSPPCPGNLTKRRACHDGNVQVRLSNQASLPGAGSIENAALRLTRRKT